ncbi:MAG: ATP-binding protein [Bacteroidales bacterium]|jgi:two-component system NtrC family sensor kinase|nr:ATP-binding protein [Bacteroidales bacterium]
MIFSKQGWSGKIAGRSFFRKYVKFGRSIYGRVVLVITLLSIFLFVSFGIIFKSVNEQYLNTVIVQSGNNVGSLVEGALYHSMLENDKGALQNTLDIIHTLAGIEDVNMYDSHDNLVYSSYTVDSVGYINADCKSCHHKPEALFPTNEKAYKIITAESECKMNNNPNGQRHLIIKTPILNSKSCYQSTCHYHKESDKVLGSLVIKVPLKVLDAAVSKSSRQFYILAILTTLLLASFLILFTRLKIKNPLNELLNASLAVADGDLCSRVKLKPNQLDDMRVVGTAFNDMLDNLQTATNELENWSHQLEYKVQKKSEELGAAQNELIHIERLASLGKLSSSVAHEINNPLSGILIYSKLVQKLLKSPEITEEKKDLMLKQLKLIETETKRCGDIVKGLLDFSKKDQEDFEPFHLHEILKDTYDLMSHSVKIANILFLHEFNAKSDLIFCSPNQIKQACVAILINATEAVIENGEIRISTYNPDESTVCFEITDNGIGISAGDIQHIFEPFFSTKQAVSGIGLGLAIVHGIVQSHHGKTSVKSESGQGTTLSINLPLIQT